MYYDLTELLRQFIRSVENLTSGDFILLKRVL